MQMLKSSISYDKIIINIYFPFNSVIILLLPLLSLLGLKIVWAISKMAKIKKIKCDFKLEKVCSLFATFSLK